MLDQARVDHRGVTNGEFAEAGIIRYGARIKELRKEGYRIAKQRLSAGGWRYTLLFDVERPIDHPPGSGSESLISSHRVDGPLSAEPESLFEVESPGPRSPYDYEEAA
jgi:hypothetical protein